MERAHLRTVFAYTLIQLHRGSMKEHKIYLFLLLIATTTMAEEPLNKESSSGEAPQESKNHLTADELRALMDQKPDEAPPSILRNLISKAADRVVTEQGAVLKESMQNPQTAKISGIALKRLAEGVARRMTTKRLQNGPIMRKSYSTRRHNYAGPPIAPEYGHPVPHYVQPHVSYRPAHPHEFYAPHPYDEDARSRAAVLDAVWRALRSAAGGALAIGGTLARNGGRLLQAKGRLMASTGPLVVALGRQVAEDAVHAKHHHHDDGHLSYSELASAADIALAQREHARFVVQDLYEPFYESVVDLGGALRVAASGTARALGDLVSELTYSAKRAYLLKE